MSDYYVFPAPQTPQPTQKQSSNIAKKALIIVGVICLIAAISSGSYFLGTKKSSSNSEPTSSPSQTLTQPVYEIPSPGQKPTGSETFRPVIPAATESAQTKLTPTVNPSPTPKLKTKILNSIPNLDGFRSSDGKGSSNLEIRAGRNTSLVMRGFVSFSLDKIPSGATIEKALLKLYQSQVVGDPYKIGGNLKVDHLTYGDALDATDYSMPALTSNIATLSTKKEVGWQEAEVTSAVNNDFANSRSKSQFRIHFTSEIKGGDIGGDFAYFDSSNDYYDNTNHHPQLVVFYY